MTKKYSFFLCLILILMLATSTVFAGDSAYHDRKMKYVIFNCGKDSNYTATRKSTDECVKILEYASYLCIDQSGNKAGDEAKLDYLRDQGVKNLLKNISEYNPKTEFYHRSFTHRGWDFHYVIDSSNWSERREILLNAVDLLFDFDKNGNQKQKNAFAKLIYYTHILGDLYYDDEDSLGYNDSKSEFVEKERGLIIPLAYAHPGEQNRDVLYELQDVFDNLLSETNKSTYKGTALKSELAKIAKEARHLAGLPGGVNSVERLQQRLKLEKDLINALEAFVPLLLKDEPFFRDAFRIEW